MKPINNNLPPHLCGGADGASGRDADAEGKDAEDLAEYLDPLDGAASAQMVWQAGFLAGVNKMKIPICMAADSLRIDSEEADASVREMVKIGLDPASTIQNVRDISARHYLCGLLIGSCVESTEARSLLKLTEDASREVSK